MVEAVLKPVVKNYRRFDRRRTNFKRWAEKRPFWGALLLIVAGVLMAISPAQTLSMFLFGSSSAKILGIVGLFFALFVFLSGVTAMTQPQLSTLAGLVGIVLTVLSIVGGTEWAALGLGALTGILGGSLCVSWIEVEEEVVVDETQEEEKLESGEDVEELRKKVEKYEEMLEEKGEDADVDMEDIESEMEDADVDNLMEKEE